MNTAAAANPSSRHSGGGNKTNSRNYYDDENEDDDVSLSFGQGNGGLCIRAGFLLLALFTFVCILTAMSSCRFLTYEGPRPSGGGTGTLSDTDSSRVINFTIADIGIYRYNPDLQGCRDIPDDIDYSGTYKTVRTGAAFAILCAATSICLVFIELTCCRFPCSATLMSSFFFFAAIFQSLTFLMYNVEIWYVPDATSCTSWSLWIGLVWCRTYLYLTLLLVSFWFSSLSLSASISTSPPKSDNGTYLCSPAAGTWFATLAVLLLLGLAMTVCCIPQPVPIVFRIQQMKNRNGTRMTDPCCAFWVVRKPNDKQDKEDEEVQDEHFGKDTDEEEACSPDMNVMTVSKKSVTPSGGSTNNNNNTVYKMPKEQEEELVTLMEQRGHLEITTALTQIRKDKHDEIERQLELLTKYKDALPDDVYSERMQTLILSLPDPQTYDAYTSTTVLNDYPSSFDENKNDHGTLVQPTKSMDEFEEYSTMDKEKEIQHEEGDPSIPPKSHGIGGRIVSSVKSTMSNVTSKVRHNPMTSRNEKTSSLSVESEGDDVGDHKDNTSGNIIQTKELGKGTIGGSFQATAVASTPAVDNTSTLADAE
jgi:hypothetical protein